MSVPPRYPYTTDLLRVENEQEYYNLYNSDFLNAFFKRTWFLLQEFFGNDEEKKKVLAVTMDLAPILVKAGTIFLFGKPVKVEVDDNSDGSGRIQAAIDDFMKRNHLNQKLKDSSKLFQAIGHTQFKLRKDKQGKAVAEEIPFDNWFPNYSGIPQGQKPNEYFLITYISNLTGDDIVEKRYIYVEQHIPGQITYYLFLNIDNKIHGQPLPFSTLPNLLQINPGMVTQRDNSVIEQTKLDTVPLVQIDADKTIKDRYGQSLLKPVRPILDEINTRLTQISLQLFKHSDPILQLPSGSVPQDEKGQVMRKKLEVFFAQSGDPDAKYITNDNPMLDQSFKYLELLVEKAAKLTQTPQSFIAADDKGGVEKAEALRTRFMLFLKRIEEYREAYSDGLEQIIRLALQIEGIDVPDDMEFKFTFDFGLPRDPQLDGEVWGAAVEQGISSVETAVKNFQQLEGDLLDEEMTRIEKDKELMAPPMPVKPPLPKPENNPQLNAA